jgi:hypothetical protein
MKRLQHPSRISGTHGTFDCNMKKGLVLDYTTRQPRVSAELALVLTVQGSGSLPLDAGENQSAPPGRVVPPGQPSHHCRRRSGPVRNCRRMGRPRSGPGRRQCALDRCSGGGPVHRRSSSHQKEMREEVVWMRSSPAWRSCHRGSSHR